MKDRVRQSLRSRVVVFTREPLKRFGHLNPHKPESDWTRNCVRIFALFLCLCATASAQESNGKIYISKDYEAPPGHYQVIRRLYTRANFRDEACKRLAHDARVYGGNALICVSVTPVKDGYFYVTAYVAKINDAALLADSERFFVY